MWKIVLAGTTAVLIAGTSLAGAQPAAKTDAQPAAVEHAQRWRPNAGDIMAFADARIAALHAGLQLSAAQEKDWPAVATAMRDLARQRSAWFSARASANKPKTPVDRLALRAQAMVNRGAALKKLAEAAGPLYNSLTPDQKHRFLVLARHDGVLAPWRARRAWQMWHGRRVWHGWQHRRG